MRKSVFVLEDNDDLRELFIYILEEQSFDVKTYPTAASFREDLSTTKPDIYILDIMLPDDNGLNVCAELKSNPTTKDIPIIMMSAHINKPEVMVKCDAEDFIAKPFDIDDFIHRINRQIINN